MATTYAAPSTCYCAMTCNGNSCQCGQIRIATRDNREPRPANQYHDICADMDYKPPYNAYDRNNSSPLRQPSPPSGYSYPTTFVQQPIQQYNEHSFSAEASSVVRGDPPATVSAYVRADDVSNPDSVSIVDQQNSYPLRRQSGSPASKERQPQHYGTSNEYQPQLITQRVPNHQISLENAYARDSAKVREEIGMLNQRLDQIDEHCRKFTKLAEDKSAMDEKVKNLAYMDAMRGKYEAEQKLKAAEERSSERPQQYLNNSFPPVEVREVNPSQVNEPKFETRVRSYSNPMRNRQLAETGFDETRIRPADNSNSMISSLQRDKSCEDKKADATREYNEDMAKLTRIMDNRRESLERAAHQESVVASTFEDDAYLAMIQSEGEIESPGYQTYEGRQPDFTSPAIMNSANLRHGSPSPQLHSQGAPYLFNEQKSQTPGIPTYQPNESPPPQRNPPQQRFSRKEYHQGRDCDGSPLRDEQQRSPSPVQEMCYFHGIDAIREEQNAYYKQLLDNELLRRSVTGQAVRMTRTNLAQGIQSRHNNAKSPRLRGNKKANIKSRQHDEFAILNYYSKVSKYDLDRAQLNMREASICKQQRRVENAQAKRTMIKTQQASDMSIAVRAKVAKIREINGVKVQQKQERKENALRHQEMLKDFLDKEKSERVDERPIAYANPSQTSAFKGNASVLDASMRKGSRSVSRSPIPGAKRLSIQNSQSRPRTNNASRMGMNESRGGDKLTVRQLDFA